MQYDKVLEQLGEFGRFQRQLSLALCVIVLLTSWCALSPVILLSQPPHRQLTACLLKKWGPIDRCRLPDFPNDTYALQGAQHELLVNSSVPRDANGQLDSCRLLVRDEVSSPADGNASSHFADHRASPLAPDNGTKTRTCDAWVFGESSFRYTLTEELGMVCEYNTWRAHQYLASSLGQLAGSLLQGWLADRFGRRKIFLLFATMEIPVYFGSAFVSSFGSLLVVRFLLTFTNMGLFMSSYVIGLEMVGPAFRMWVGMALMLSWVLGQMLFCGVAILLQHWSKLTLVMAAPSALAPLLFWWMPESPRWLITQSRLEEASDVIQLVAKRNRMTLDVGDLAEVSVKEEIHEKPWHVFRFPRLVVRYSILCLCWACVSMVYYGLTYNTSNLSGDLYVNFMLVELVEMVGYVSSLLVINRAGRRPLLASSFIVAGSACLATTVPVLLVSGAASEEASMLGLSLLGKMAVSAAFGGIFQHTAELYPTLLRSFGLGLSSTCSRLGSMFSPYIADLGLYVGGRLGQALPLVVFGGSALLTGGLALGLPETLNSRLPDTLEQACSFGRKQESGGPRTDDCADTEVERKPMKCAA